MTCTIQKISSRPKISPRLTAKVEAAKRAKMGESKCRPVTAPSPARPEPHESLSQLAKTTNVIEQNDTLESLVDTLRREVNQERDLRIQLGIPI